MTALLSDSVVYWPVRDIGSPQFETLGYARNYTEADVLSSHLMDEARARGYEHPSVFYLRFDEVSYDQPMFVFDWSHDC